MCLAKHHTCSEFGLPFKYFTEKMLTIIAASTGGMRCAITYKNAQISCRALSTIRMGKSKQAQTKSSVLDVYSEPPSEARSQTWIPPEVPAAGITQRSATIAIVGEPNAGKSTLLNALLGKTLSAVSPKYNTTRDRLLGVLTEGDCQLCLTDTPGFVRKEEGRGKYVAPLVTAAVEAVPEADVVLMVVDVAKRFSPESQAALSDMIRLSVENAAIPLIAANKCDLLRGMQPTKEQEELMNRSTTSTVGKYLTRVPKDGQLLALKLGFLEDWMEAEVHKSGLVGPKGFDSDEIWIPIDENPNAVPTPSQKLENGVLYQALPSPYKHLRPVLPISASLDRGIDLLRESLQLLAPKRPWSYGREMLTDQAPLDLVREQIRAQLFHVLHREVPYKVRQETRSWREVALDAEGRIVQETTASAIAASGIPRPETAFGTLNKELGSSMSVLSPHAPGGRGVVIHQDIQVPSQTVASMLLAREGYAIKYVARKAGQSIEKLLGKKVFLRLHVTVKEQLKRNPGLE